MTVTTSGYLNYESFVMTFLLNTIGVFITGLILFPIYCRYFSQKKSIELVQLEEKKENDLN